MVESGSAVVPCLDVAGSVVVREDRELPVAETLVQVAQVVRAAEQRLSGVGAVGDAGRA